MNTNIYLTNGEVSAYGLSIGYNEVTTKETESGKTFRMVLAKCGDEYSFDAYYEEEPRERIGNRLAGWAQFDNLKDARKFYRRQVRETEVGRVLANCVTYWATTNK